MKRLTNRPTKGPTVEAYKGSPLDLRLVFPEGYAVPEVTVEIHRHSKRLLASNQPTVTANGLIRLVSLTGEQTRLLPTDCEIVVFLDDVAKLTLPLVLDYASTLRSRDTSVPIVLDALLSINVDINDIDRVLIAQVAAATAVDAMETTRQYRDQARNAVGNIMTLIGVGPHSIKVGIGGNIQVSRGTSPRPFIRVKFLQPS